MEIDWTRYPEIRMAGETNTVHEDHMARVEAAFQARVSQFPPVEDTEDLDVLFSHFGFVQD